MQWISALVSIWFVTVITVTSGHQNVNPLKNGQEQEPHDHPAVRQASGRTNSHGGPHHGIDRNAVHDQEHIKEHLDGKVKTDEKMSDEELQFHYFKLHDYDDNNMLDGIEIISALTHHQREQKDGSEPVATLTDIEIGESIDSILSDNDLNRDGYIDYPEFITAQRGNDPSP